MKIIAEISKPHYHPGKDYDLSAQVTLTKKRDLSVPPNWVANERIEIAGVSYPVVMPPREHALVEDRQEVHVHFPKYILIQVNGVSVQARVKVHEEQFEPRVHFDHMDGALFHIESGVTEVEL